MLEEHTNGRSSIEISVNELNKGFYFVWVKSNGLTTTQKIIKE
jgi:hypothetical protein